MMEEIEEEEIIISLCILIICAGIQQYQRCMRRKRLWVRPWISRRDKQGAYHALLQEISTEDPKSFNNFLRMDMAAFNELLQMVTPLIKKKDTLMRGSISPAERLALTLRFLASGDSYESLQYLYRIPKSTISYIIPETCEAIYRSLKDKYMKVPDSPEAWDRISREFEERWNFPNCIGAIDGKHIALRCPLRSESAYFNYKHYFSIILLAIVDADYNFLYVDVGCNGRSNDSSVFGRSTINELLESGGLKLPPAKPLPGRHNKVPYVLVGDDAFCLKDYLLKPYQIDCYSWTNEYSTTDCRGQEES